MSDYRKVMSQWKDFRLGEVKTVKEGHTVSFSKEEMAQLHSNGQIEKDGHTYIYNESVKRLSKKVLNNAS
jgi:hypothetical protein